MRLTARAALLHDRWAERGDGCHGVAVDVDESNGTIVGIGDHDGPCDVDVLAPGFVDLQVNGIADVDVATADGGDWTRLDRLLAAEGVTTWCPTLVTAPLERYPAALERIRVAMDRPGTHPTIAGVHLEGPFLGGAPGAHPRSRSLLRPVDLDWVAGLPDHVAVVTIAAELDRAGKAISLLRERGVLVSIGHSTPSIDEFRAAVDAGAQMVTHLYNGMSGLHHRSPGLAAMALTDGRVQLGLIADGVHVHPLMTRLAVQSRPEGVVLVTDAVAWQAGTIDTIGIEMRDGAPRLSDGTLAGSARTMDAAVRHLVHDCAVDVEQALRAASTRPAALLGLVDRGEIAVGKRADLVALDRSGSVVQTYVAGQPLLSGGA